MNFNCLKIMKIVLNIISKNEENQNMRINKNFPKDIY